MIENSEIDYNHQVYELKDKNETVGTFFGYNNNDKLFSGIWCHDDLNNYVIDQYGDIVTYKEGNKLVLTDDSYVRKIGLSDSEYDINQGTKNESRMIYVGETETVEVDGESIIYNKNTLRIVDGNSEYIGFTYLNFGYGVIFVLDESDGSIKYPNDGYTKSDDNGNIIFKINDYNYCYYNVNDSEINNERDKLKGIIISNKVTRIGDSAFYYCTNLTSVTIPNSVITIGEKAFYNCFKLTSVTIPDLVMTIGNSAFEGCVELKDVTIPNSVTTIGEYAFLGCAKLQIVTIGNSVKTIGNSAFEGCVELKDVTIPNSVTTIGDHAFYNCFNLTSITIPNSVTIIGEEAFSDIAEDCKVYVYDSDNTFIPKSQLQNQVLITIFGNKIQEVEPEPTS